jgi:hypothetical protein
LYSIDLDYDSDLNFQIIPDQTETFIDLSEDLNTEDLD